MSSKKIKAQVRIGRYMNSDVHYLTIEDRASGLQFVSLEFDAEQLSNLLNQSASYMEGEVRGLENVGKKYKSQPVQAKIPDHISPYGKSEIAEYLKEYKEVFEKSNEGWMLNTYIGSQSSITKEDDGYFANLIMFQYVEEKDNG